MSGNKKKNNFIRLDTILKHLPASVSEHPMMRVFAAWNEALGPQMAERVSITKFEYGTLMVKAVSHPWMMEVIAQKRMIIKKMNTILRENLIKNIVVSV